MFNSVVSSEVALVPDKTCKAEEVVGMKDLERHYHKRRQKWR